MMGSRQFVIWVGVIIGVVGVVFIILFLFWPQHQFTLGFAAAVLSAAGACYAAFFTGAALAANVHQARQQLSIDLLKDLEDMDLTRLRSLLVTIDFSSLSQLEGYKKIADDPDLFLVARAVLNRLDLISLAIQVGAADELIARTSIGMFTQNVYDRLGNFIAEIRGQGFPIAWGQVEKMARTWAAGRSLVNGKPLKPISSTFSEDFFK